jgi:putative transposase
VSVAAVYDRRQVDLMRKPRLTRLDEFFEEQPLIFITFCTDKRRPLLATPSLHESFRAFCVKSQTHQNSVGRYVIMPDHLHLFVQLYSPDKLSMWIKSLKNSLSKTLRLLGHPAPHWQKDFFDHVLRSEESYGSKWEYVEYNPVRAGLVSEASHWPYQGEIAELSFR